MARFRRRGDQSGRRSEPDAPSGIPHQLVCGDGRGGGHARNRPCGVDVNAAHGLQGQHAKSAFCTCEFSDQSTKKSGGSCDLKSCEQVGHGCHCAHLGQLRPPTTTIAVDQFQPNRGCGAQPGQQWNERGVKDAQRGECDLRAHARPVKHAENWASGNKRQAKHHERECTDRALQHRQHCCKSSKTDGCKITPKVTPRCRC